MAEVENDLRGKVTNVFRKLGCVAIEVKKGTLRRGDEVLFFKERRLDPSEGDPEEYVHRQVVDSLEIDHHPVEVVSAGMRCGIKINLPANLLPPNNCVVTRIPAG